MVPDVIGFGAKLEAKPFVYGDGFEQAHIPVLISGLINQIADSLCVESTGRRRGEDWRSIRIGRSEPLATRSKCANDLGIAVNHPILAVYAASEVRVKAHTRVVICGGHT